MSVTLYHGFQLIDECGCNVQVDGSMYNVDAPDDFFAVVSAMLKLPVRLDRAAYENACTVYGVTPLDDQETTQFCRGDYDLGTYFATAAARRDLGIPNTLHQRRGFFVEAQQRAIAAAPAPVASFPSMNGQLWEDCVCGAQPVYMPLHLCQKCWPAV
jgi:hypothetical protein